MQSRIAIVLLASSAVPKPDMHCIASAVSKEEYMGLCTQPYSNVPTSTARLCEKNIMLSRFSAAQFRFRFRFTFKERGNEASGSCRPSVPPRTFTVAFEATCKQRPDPSSKSTWFVAVQHVRSITSISPPDDVTCQYTKKTTSAPEHPCWTGTQTEWRSRADKHA